MQDTLLRPVERKESLAPDLSAGQCFSKTTPAERPEWADAKTITRLLGPSRSSLYELASKGLIRTASLRGRGKIRGRRLFSYDSVRDWIESQATDGIEGTVQNSNKSAAA